MYDINLTQTSLVTITSQTTTLVGRQNAFSSVALSNGIALGSVTLLDRQNDGVISD